MLVDGGQVFSVSFKGWRYSSSKCVHQSVFCLTCEIKSWLAVCLPPTHFKASYPESGYEIHGNVRCKEKHTHTCTGFVALPSPVTLNLSLSAKRIFNTHDLTLLFQMKCWGTSIFTNPLAAAQAHSCTHEGIRV